MNINWWYDIVAPALNTDHARLVCEVASNKITIDGLARTVSNLESKLRDSQKLNDELSKRVKSFDTRDEFVRPTQEWVERAQVTAAKQRVSELEQEIRYLQAKRTEPIRGMISSQLELLRQALRNEKAYTLFLEDCLDCLNPSVVFNSLPLEKRKEYFDIVDGIKTK